MRGDCSPTELIEIWRRDAENVTERGVRGPADYRATLLMCADQLERAIEPPLVAPDDTPTRLKPRTISDMLDCECNESTLVVPWEQVRAEVSRLQQRIKELENGRS